VTFPLVFVFFVQRLIPKLHEEHEGRRKATKSDNSDWDSQGAMLNSPSGLVHQAWRTRLAIFG